MRRPAIAIPAGAFFLACWLALAEPTFAAAAPAPSAPMVAAGADMTLALKEIADSFYKQTNKKVSLSFGASAAQAQKIAEGAPVEVFLSADEANVISLKERGKAQDEGKIYGVGRIVVFLPGKNRSGPGRDALAGLKGGIEQGKIKRLAISNPDLCPYGRAAREALHEAGVWTTFADRLVITEDAAQAAELALTGKVDAALLPLSLAVSPLARSGGAFTVIDSKAHRPLRQRMALMMDAGETARQFYAYLQAPVARNVLRRYGYTSSVGRE